MNITQKALGLNLKLPETINDNFVDYLELLRKSLKEKELNILIFTWWATWFQRNKIIFDKITLNPQQTANIAINAFQYWDKLDKINLEEIGIKFNQSLKNKTSTSTPRNRSSPWSPPQQGFLEINFDGAKTKDGTAGGYCLREHRGHLITAEALQCENCPIIVAEALGLCAAVQEARRLGAPKITIEGDNLCVINFTRKIWTIPWEMGKIMEDIDHDISVLLSGHNQPLLPRGERSGGLHGQAGPLPSTTLLWEHLYPLPLVFLNGTKWN